MKKKRHTGISICTLALLLMNLCCYSQKTTLDSLKITLKTAKHDTIRAAIYVALSDELYLSDPDTVIPLCKKALAIIENNTKRKNLKEKKAFVVIEASAFNNIGFIHKQRGEILMALEYYGKALKLFEDNNDKNGISTSLNNIGMIYNHQGDIPRALDHFERSLKIEEETGDMQSIGVSFNNIAGVYTALGEFTKALEYHFKALKIREDIGHKHGIALSLNNIGAIYNIQGDNVKALEYFNRSLKIREEIGDIKGIAFSLNTIGVIYVHQGKHEKALAHYEKSLRLYRSIGEPEGIAHSLSHISGVYFKQRDYDRANSYSDSALFLSKKLGFPDEISYAELTQSKVDSARGNFRSAFEHYQQHIFYRDSTQNEINRKASTKNQLKYEYEKKEAVLKEQQEKERLVSKERNHFQQIIIWSVAFGLILVLVFAGFVVRTLKTTRIQKIMIEEKQREILDSIHYAKRIQNSLLPSEKYIDKNLNRLKK